MNNFSRHQLADKPTRG